MGSISSSNYIYKIITFLLTLFSIVMIYSSDHLKGRINNDHYCVESDSLDISLPVMSLFEDSNGLLWIGTKGKGVGKYDGHELIFLTMEDGLCGNDVTNIIEDNEGNIWFGTYTDMCKYNGGNFVSFQKDSDGKPALGWGWKDVKKDKLDDIWINTHHGMFIYSSKSSLTLKKQFKEWFAPFDLSQKENSSFCNTPGLVSMDLLDSKGNRWFGTDGLGVFKYDGNAYEHFTKNDGLRSNNISSIVEGNDGKIWFSCIEGLQPDNNANGGVAYYEQGEIFNFLNTNMFTDESFYEVFVDSNNNTWLISSENGVYKYNGIEFTLYELPHDFIIQNDFGIQTIFEDSRNRIWFGFNGGLFRLDQDSLVNVTQIGPWS